MPSDDQGDHCAQVYQGSLARTCRGESLPPMHGENLTQRAANKAAAPVTTTCSVSTVRVLDGDVRYSLDFARPSFQGIFRNELLGALSHLNTLGQVHAGDAR